MYIGKNIKFNKSKSYELDLERNALNMLGKKNFAKRLHIKKNTHKKINNLIESNIIKMQNDGYVEGLRGLLKLLPGKFSIPLALAGTAVLVTKHDNEENEEKVMLQLRADVNKLGLIGGGIELGETYTQCAIRELFEETGLKTYEDNLELKQIYSGNKHITVYQNGDIVYHTIVLYHLKYSETFGNIIDNNNETKELKWYSISEIKNMLEDAENYFFHSNISIIRDIVDIFVK